MRRLSKTKTNLLIFVIFLLHTILLTSCTSNNLINDDIKIENKKIETSNMKEQSEYYKLLLRFGFNDNPEPSDLFGRDNFLSVEKEINLYLNENYDYIELKAQPVYYIGNYTGSESFAISKDTINQQINMEEKSFNATDLKTIEIGEKLSKNFSSKTVNGRAFESKDFIVSEENQEINIILGNHYIDQYKLGDILKLELHKKNIEFKVIGFLEKDLKLNIDNGELILDNYIVVPFYDIEYSPNNKEEELYQQLWYSQKNEGLIKSSEKETIIKLKKDIDNINKKYDLFYEIQDTPIKIHLN